MLKVAFYIKSILSYRIALFKVLSENGKNLQEFEESAGSCSFHECDIWVSFTYLEYLSNTCFHIWFI